MLNDTAQHNPIQLYTTLNQIVRETAQPNPIQLNSTLLYTTLQSTIQSSPVHPSPTHLYPHKEVSPRALDIEADPSALTPILLTEEKRREEGRVIEGGRDGMGSSE
jgi:hypothetical protein